MARANGGALPPRLDCEVDALTARALAACDGLDGVEDGLVSDPEACKQTFDAFAHVGAAVACAGGDGRRGSR